MRLITIFLSSLKIFALTTIAEAMLLFVNLVKRAIEFTFIFSFLSLLFLLLLSTIPGVIVLKIYALIRITRSLLIKKLSSYAIQQEP